MPRSIECMTSCASAVILSLSTTVAAYAALEEGQVLLLYNHFDGESDAIAAEYLKFHRGVVARDLNIDYDDAKSWPKPCESCEGCYDINRYYVTAAAFRCWIKEPLHAFITNYNKKHDPDIIAIVTTRGVPAAIAEEFVDICPVPPPLQCPGAGIHQIASGVEAQLSRLGREGIEVEANPYYQRLNLPFEDFLASGDCGSQGPAFAADMFLVSRLDSGPVGGSHLTGVLQLISRSLSPSVNQAEAVLVYDDCPCSSLLISPHHAMGGDFMRQRGWQVYYDNTARFLNGNPPPPATLCAGMTWLPQIEGVYATCPELVHVTGGVNHYVVCHDISGCASEPVCHQYITQFHNTHPAGLFISEESYNGWTIHQPVGAAVSHGQVLDWIAGGGSFACGNVDEPLSHSVNSTFMVVNLYEHGLSWGEAVYSGIKDIGEFQTPIGDPLARVTVTRGTGASCASATSPPMFIYPFCDPQASSNFHCFGDLNHDESVDGVDVAILQSWWGCTSCHDGDIDNDGVVGGADLAILLGNWGLLADLDDDREVDCEDRAILIAAIGGSYVAAYDFNCDGVITMADATTAHWTSLDVNGDGKEDCDDVCEVLAHCCGSAPYDSHYDFGCDGVVDMADVTHIHNRITQQLGISACPSCPPS